MVNLHRVEDNKRKEKAHVSRPQAWSVWGGEGKMKDEVFKKKLRDLVLLISDLEMIEISWRGFGTL